MWGTQPDSIDEAEDRDRWMACLQRLDIKQPPGGMVTTEEGALSTAAKLGYPVSVPTLGMFSALQQNCCRARRDPGNSNHS